MGLKEQKHVLEEEFPLSRQKVWELLSQTDHLNRVIGLYPIRSNRLETRKGGSGFIRELAAKVAGVIPMRWKEHPFEWVKEERYAVIREYSGGPLQRFYGGIELEDADTVLPDGTRATRVRLFAYFTPANALGLLAIPLIGLSSMRKTMRYLYSFVQLKQQMKEHLLPQPAQAYSVQQEELNPLLAKLRESLPGEEKLVQLLAEHLSVSGDDDVIDMRPYVLAASWRAEREAVLRLFLYATKLGITNLSWHLICPNCRVTKGGADTMSGLTSQYHCDFCGIDYEAKFDRYVELCFSVHPSIRRAIKHVFCVGGPMLTPHIYAQQEIADQAETTLVYPEVEDKLRIRVLRHNHMLPLYDDHERVSQRSAADLKDTYHVIYDGAEWSPALSTRPQSGSQLRLENRSGGSIIVALEKDDWDEHTVTAAKVTTMHEFRSLFSSEVLAPGQQVGIENVTLLFSDLLGSTAYYEHVGDALAYGQVRKHFDFLLYWVHLNKGTLVKTIGDAVMAVFEHPEHAVKAALDIQTHVDEFNQGNPSSTPMVIKIGLYHGPAIVVNSNGMLDYFGRTVNLASRTQGLSLGGDIMVSQACADRPGVQAMLSGYRAEMERFERHLKGIDEVVALARIKVPQPLTTGLAEVASASESSEA
ncbi:DUF5939 domain-containing protein [Paenibacillus rigui]|uniref:Guanylate cyclase n=1 Tax=Paenibacillus rigui TaxID=554312 RepID=A0A229UJL7_9BACL|nr:DUF5939 domain-containing protein [Paenibacillus rigui]OXM83495.1 guanylate cyclase [Paenibacillus rigui]